MGGAGSLVPEPVGAIGGGVGWSSDPWREGCGREGVVAPAWWGATSSMDGWCSESPARRGPGACVQSRWCEQPGALVRGTAPAHGKMALLLWEMAVQLGMVGKKNCIQG